MTVPGEFKVQPPPRFGETSFLKELLLLEAINLCRSASFFCADQEPTHPSFRPVQNFFLEHQVSNERAFLSSAIDVRKKQRAESDRKSLAIATR
jgi:hypothetical protein